MRWLAAALLLLAQPLRAQMLSVGDPREDYARVLGLMGFADLQSFVIRPLTESRAFLGIEDTDHPWSMFVSYRLPARGAHLAPLELTSAFNSRFPTGQNDGALWQGRGLSAALSAGGAYFASGLMVQLRPTVTWSANADFPLAPLAPPSDNSRFANPYHTGLNGARIDLPQRFGDQAYTQVEPGQSEISFRRGGVLLGVSSTSLWWGPGIRNAIVMSNNAAGVPHAFLGTGKAINVGFARLESRIIWGRLRESGFFDTVSTNDTRLLTGLVVALEPSFLPGLTLGGTRVFYEYWPKKLGLEHLLRVFTGVTKRGFATPDNPQGSDRADQILSLFGRWAFPHSGFEAYFEWARNDHNWDIRDFLLEPEHSQAYTLGFQKANRLQGGRIFRLQGELTHLERSATRQVRGTPTYYSHALVRHGYTQHGQVLGAGIGPGGDSQYLGGDLFTHWGRIGGFIGRQVHDNDAYYALTGDTISFGQHYVETQAGARVYAWRGPVELGAELVVSRHMNRYYLLHNDPVNVNLLVSARWQPRRNP